MTDSAAALKEEVADVIPIRAKLNVQSPQESIDWLNILIYGEPGAGKTFFSGTALDHPETRPVLMLDVDGGVTTLRKRQDLDVIQIRDMLTLQNTGNALYNDCKSGDSYYKTVVIDTGTELQKIDMATVMKEQFNKKPETTDIDVPSPREWGKSGNRMREILRVFRDLPMNFILTMHLNEDISDSGLRKVYPSVPGKLKNELSGFFDVVGYLRTMSKKNGTEVEIIREMQFVNTEKVLAKDRFTALGQTITNPTMPLIWNMTHE